MAQCDAIKTGPYITYLIRASYFTKSGHKWSQKRPSSVKQKSNYEYTSGNANVGYELGDCQSSVSSTKDVQLLLKDISMLYVQIRNFLKLFLYSFASFLQLYHSDLHYDYTRSDNFGNIKPRLQPITAFGYTNINLQVPLFSRD